MIRAELEGRPGRGPDGQAHTREIKLAAFFTPTTRDAQGHPMRDPQSTTYLASFVSSDRFGGLVRRAALARGVAHAGRVIFLGDGAVWVWEIARTCFAQAVQILDYFHASEHVGTLAKAIYSEAGTAQNCTLRWQSLLFDSELDVLLAEARAAADPTPTQAVQRELDYLELNRARLDYRHYRAQRRAVWCRNTVVDAMRRPVEASDMRQIALAFLFIAVTAVAEPSYIVAVSERTAADLAWKRVVDRLTAKHHAGVLTWRTSPDEALAGLRSTMPRYTCFVARPEEATREFVQTVHRLTRRLDDDPYTDTLWGILTGFDATNALAIAAEEKPLVVHNIGSGTEIALDRCESGTWFCELRKGHMVQMKKGGTPQEMTVEPDTTKALVELMNAGAPDLWVTSGHATERDWMIGFRYKNGFWKSKGGQLFGEDLQGKRYDVNSPNPKVYLPVGNCLIGNIDGPDAMALAYFKSASVRQMAAYVLPTWYGYQGWGMLDYFVEQPGRYTLTESFHANNLALVHRLLKFFPGAEKIESVDPMGRAPKGVTLPAVTKSATDAGLGAQDLRGLLFDRDNVAFYGDPAWEARMAPGRLNWSQELAVAPDGTHTFTIKPLAGSASWEAVNRNGSQRGGRPIIQYLPKRIDPAQVTVLAGKEFEPVIADDFLLVPLPVKREIPLTVQFRVNAAAK